MYNIARDGGAGAGGAAHRAASAFVMKTPEEIMIEREARAAQQA